MKKFIFCISLSLAGLMTACVDKNEAVDADSKPSWLGGSIYQELKNPQYLSGTFTNYVRLIDDLNYAETLNRTGSKTIFPANDEAFERFFSDNEWGVSSYDQLTDAQKQQLLYSSMLDNAMLVGMLSNVSNGNDEMNKVRKGMAVKHQSNLQVVATVERMTADEMPKGNPYWDQHRKNGEIYVVSDATTPMLVHFTREHMLTNNITTKGDDSDFAILTGTPYEDGMAYIFDDQITHSDVTCLNGYVHQVKDVIVPPGNMAQRLRADGQMNYFSRILDYFSAPYENQTLTDAYNAVALEKGLPTIDMIYEVRYFNRKQNHAVERDPDNNVIDAKYRLDYNPGWNEYSPIDRGNDGVDWPLSDIGAMFAPTDEAVVKFFTEGGDGAYLIDLYGCHKGADNTEANLAENLDTLFAQPSGSGWEILTKFVRNLMKSSFVETVPSKFHTIQNDAKDYMGVTTDLLTKRADGTYDIVMANNGVIYKMDELIAPDEYQSVMAPSSVYPDMHVMNWGVQDEDNLKVSFHYYLMAMKSNFAFFIPDDAAFSRYYVDPTSLGKDLPQALKFTWEGDTTVNADGERIVRNVGIRCRAYAYDKATNTVGEVLNNGGTLAVDQWRTQFIDILNFHTVVLNDGETLGTNKYYKTKHGGEIRITGNREGCTVASGQQIDNGLTPSLITRVYDEKNGQAFRIDHVIESPRNSVSKTLEMHSDRFSEFYDLCNGFDPELLAWAGISNEENSFGTTEQDNYIVFTADRGSGSNKVSRSCLDYNVKMFNTYNYTLYAPNNAAMQKAYAAGLPKWDEINALRETYQDDLDADGNPTEAALMAKADCKRMIDIIRDFVRYHFQNSSVYADNVVESNRYNSLSTDDMGLAIEMQVSGGSGKIQVTDATGATRTVDATDTSKLSNLMCRDYWFDGSRDARDTHGIYTSSFCVIHELSEPLCSGAFAKSWSN